MNRTDRDYVELAQQNAHYHQKIAITGTGDHDVPLALAVPIKVKYCNCPLCCPQDYPANIQHLLEEEAAMAQFHDGIAAFSS